MPLFFFLYLSPVRPFNIVCVLGMRLFFFFLLSESRTSVGVGIHYKGTPTYTYPQEELVHLENSGVTDSTVWLVLVSRFMMQTEGKHFEHK
jgi:hypothetical protein